MDLQTLVGLTIGATLLTCVLAVVGVHVYARGRAQRAALVDRLTAAGQVPYTGRRRHFRDLDRRLRRTRLGRELELRLAATGLDVTPGEFFAAMIGLVGGLWLIGQATLAPFFGPLAGLAGVWAAVQFLNWQRQKRIEKFINQLPELARILANATHAGLALRTAIGMAAEELEAPAGEELANVANQLAVGVAMEDALDEMAKRLPSRELVVLVTTLVLSNRAGGQVVSALRNLTETLEERKETRREVRTQLSQVSMTSYAVPVLGIGSLFLMNGVKDGALERMTGSPLGQGAVIIAFALYAVGFVLIRRMSRIDV
ncbi:tight adherence protein B [Streptomyces sp. SAI-135]|uniref:type II secretion system F family protein n=1 Tax=unclassified Streptomyces TaxID=2593676 RepID=UPI002475EF0C|nr:MULTISPECIES: type II secretion system F family protein [unclassified Streptomyces]MDH6516797.1 tight adherence protein B [Streptomyces sp. SAI-090]MDH6549014.1 tight adherence protein B [Streptomyces sp. SAI-041]MDH6586971.1 tight adherence protein B [Streptomyces sp. SAI-133]MDH6619114.1 tight adherence protein B [Streptomyces sp. SAI-135]